MDEKYTVTRRELKQFCYPVNEMGDNCGENDYFCPRCPVWKRHAKILGWEDNKMEDLS